MLALFRKNGHWGVIAKSNFTGLRCWEAVYGTLRELVMSYFENYYNVKHEKTLRGYTLPLDLKTFDRRQWMTRDKTMEKIAQRLDEIRRVHLFTRPMIAQLSLVDVRSFRAGLLGANIAGLHRPPQ